MMMDDGKQRSATKDREKGLLLIAGIVVAAMVLAATVITLAENMVS